MASIGKEDEEIFDPLEWNDFGEFLGQICTQPLVIQELATVYADNMLPSTYTQMREWHNAEQLASDIHANITLRLGTKAVLGELGNGSISFLSDDQPRAGDCVSMLTFRIIMPRHLAQEKGGVSEEIWERLRGFWSPYKTFVHPLPAFEPSPMYKSRQAHWAAKRQQQQQQ